MRKDLILILYVDDAGIAAPNREIIMDFVQELREAGFDLDIEGDFNSYLGIGIEELPDGTRHMTQKGLIRKIIATPRWRIVSRIGHLLRSWLWERMWTESRMTTKHGAIPV